nr:MAG TPA: hypothetical protein [Caudoviricetes sp.]
MSVHVGVKSANMLSCGSQRAEAFPYKRAAVWCHTLVADSPYCIGVWSGIVFSALCVCRRMGHKMQCTGASGIQILDTRCRYAISGTYPSVLRAWGLILTAGHP